MGMYITNNALTPNPEVEPSILVSSPKDWFLLKKGLRMSSWADDAVKFYMFGNPLIWWSASFAVCAIIGVMVLQYVVEKRGLFITDHATKLELWARSRIAVGAWAFNYLPFFLMGRVTYLHHYYPALANSVLCIAILIEFITKTFGLHSKSKQIYFCIALLYAISFITFKDLVYGITGSSSKYQYLAWLSSWNMANIPEKNVFLTTV